MSENLSSNEQPTTNVQTTPTNKPNDFFSQSNNLLMIAGLLCILGFFLDWLDINTGNEFGNRLKDEFIPKINGTFLLSKANEIPSYGIFLAAFLLCIPVCSAIIAYNAYNKKLSEKRTAICISLTTIIPITFFVEILFLSSLISDTRMLRELAGLHMGIGLIMMAVGSGYFLFYQINEIIKYNKKFDNQSIITYGVLGGVISAICGYILIKIKLHSEDVVLVTVLVFLIFISGIILTIRLYNKKVQQTVSYTRNLFLGFIVSIAYALTCYFIAKTLLAEEVQHYDVVKSLLIVYVLLVIQLGFVISAITASTKNKIIANNSQETKAADNIETTQLKIVETPNPNFDFSQWTTANKKKIIYGGVALVSVLVLYFGTTKILSSIEEKKQEKLLIEQRNNDSILAAKQADSLVVLDKARRTADSIAATSAAQFQTQQPTNNYANTNGNYTQASERILSYADIANLNKNQLKIMRNEIFARHGYIFKTDDMKSYFSAQNWYRPLYSDVTNQLTEIEKANIDFIKKYE